MLMKKLHRLLPILTIMLLAGCASAPQASKPIPQVTIAGIVTLNWSPVNSPFWWADDGSTCHGQGKYAAVVEGGQVEIGDASGKTLQLGKLGVAKYDGTAITCTYPFKFKAPASSFYSVIVNGQTSKVSKADIGNISITFG